MKKYLLLFFIAIQVSATTLVPYNPPESFLHKLWRCNIHISCYGQQFGTTLTTLNNTDQQSAFPSLYNTNNTAINNGKMETSTTSVLSITTLSNLITVGALSSGSLTTGFTAIPVSLGGTGTTSPTLNQIMLGNGTSGLKVVGLGTSGQFFTSNGIGNAPSWTTSSIDGTLNYNFTGTTYIKNLNASSTVANPIVLNGVSLSTPSTQGTVGTTLVNNGSGVMTWQPVGRYTFGTTTAIQAPSVDWATSTPINIPANVMTASSTIEVNAVVTCTGDGTGGGGEFYVRTAINTFFKTSGNNLKCPVSGSNTYTIKVLILNNNSVSAQTAYDFMTGMQTSGTIVVQNTLTYNSVSGGGSSIDTSNAFSVYFVIRANDSHSTVILQNVTFVVNP